MACKKDVSGTTDFRSRILQISASERKTAEKSENLIAQNFQADKPNEKWLTDITEIPCQDGKVYLAPVLDCYDGMIVAFSMADHMRASLCVDAFEQACRKERCRGMLLPSDRGSQYTSREY